MRVPEATNAQDQRTRQPWQPNEMEEKMTRTGQRKKNSSEQAAVAERAGHGPKIAVEGDFLVVKWRKERVAEAMGMTLADVLKAHLVPALEATKTSVFTHRGVIVQTREYPDWNARLKALKLVSQLYGACQ